MNIFAVQLSNIYWLRYRFLEDIILSVGFDKSSFYLQWCKILSLNFSRSIKDDLQCHFFDHRHKNKLMFSLIFKRWNNLYFQDIYDWLRKLLFCQIIIWQRNLALKFKYLKSSKYSNNLKNSLFRSKINVENKLELELFDLEVLN